MERVAFLIESTGERIGCLLNPETLTVRRHSGVRPRRSSTGPVTSSGLKDDPLLSTGGGTTEVALDLLFDVKIAGSSITATDVRDLTSPLWELSENSTLDRGAQRPPLVRFIWGKSWNIPGVIVSVSEKLERFSSEGAPERSWLRLKLWRVSEPSDRLHTPETSRPLPELLDPDAEVPPDKLFEHEITGDGNDASSDPLLASERVDEISFRYYGTASFWRVIAAFNDLIDPLRVPVGHLLRVPSQDVLESQR